MRSRLFMSTVLLLPMATGTARLRFARPTVAHAHTGHGHVPPRLHAYKSYRRGVTTRASDEGGDAAVLASFDLAGVAQHIADGKATRIVTMPDFRSEGGLYDQLETYALPFPEAIFDLDFFRSKPGAFNLLAKELYPGNFRPTPAHYFIKLLHDKGLLLRCFTQNIDSLESQAGIPKEKIVAAHGNFDGARCIACKAAADPAKVKATLEADGTPVCSECGGLVKPNIVFFGEPLPERFFSSAAEDMPECDLLIVLGTSLKVFPFAGLVGQVSDTTPRLLINREMVGNEWFRFEWRSNKRDALYLGDCDQGVWELVELLGWQQEFHALLPPPSSTTTSRAKL